MEAWSDVLANLISQIGPSATGPETRWAVIGSAATAVQGCAVTPRGTDLLAVHWERVRRFVALMEPYNPRELRALSRSRRLAFVQGSAGESRA